VNSNAPTPRQSAWLVAVMLLLIVIPAGITLHRVRVPATITLSSANPTPQGYTWSLLLFIVPIAVIGGWFLPQERLRIPRRAFWLTLAILVPVGFAMDFFFANRFFLFLNPGATLEIHAPAIGGVIPIEEYVFYFTGFLAVLLLYVWTGEYWLAAYCVPDPHPDAARMRRLLNFHPESLAAGIVLIAAAIAYKKFVSPVPDGLPGYFIALAAGVTVPSMALYPAARNFIHWRALSLTLFMILLISLFWEATLAVPYGWWSYRPEQMTGIFVGAWARLPIEAVLVWISVTYTTAIVYEVLKLKLKKS
jgi:hypothetical protein